MKKFHLLDIDHGKKAIRQEHIYETASKIALKYGYRLTPQADHIREFWKYDEPYFAPCIFYKNVKSSSEIGRAHV